MDSEASFFYLDDLKKWNLLVSGNKLPKSISLFPRIDLTKVSTEAQGPVEKVSGTTDMKPEITIEEFSKVDLRVATVVHAEKVPRAKKLLKLEVDLGRKRVIVAGIAENYAPEDPGEPERVRPGCRRR